MSDVRLSAVSCDNRAMVDFDPYAAEFVANPYPTFARLRREHPLFYDDEWGVTFFTRHRDVKGILRDRRFGRDVRHAVPPDEIDQQALARIYPEAYPLWTRYIREAFIDFEPPEHTRLRRLVQQALSRRSSETYRAQLIGIARDIVNAAIDRGRMEAVAEYATPIPLAMISELMGISPDAQQDLVDWSNAIVRLYDQACTEAEGQKAEQATSEFVAFMQHEIERRRSQPGDDLVTALIEAEVAGDRLDEDEIIATSILTLNAGHEATVQAIGNALLALADHPDQYRLLRGAPGTVSAAVEELLRFDTPLQMFERWVLEDVDWAGASLRRGTKVGLLLGSANHDEDEFDDPERLDVGRAANDHVSFGGGIHHCVGAPLARLELEVALGVFVSRVAEFGVRADPGELPRTPSLVFRGVRELPLEIR